MYFFTCNQEFSGVLARVSRNVVVYLLNSSSGEGMILEKSGGNDTMELKYEIITDDNLIVIVCNGDFDMGTFLRYVKEIMSSPQFKPTMNIIADLRLCIVKTDYKLIIDFVTFMDRQSFTFRGCHWALIYPPEADAMMIQLYESISMKLHLRARAFSTMVDAENWVKN